MCEVIGSAIANMLVSTLAAVAANNPPINPTPCRLGAYCPWRFLESLGGFFCPGCNRGVANSYTLSFRYTPALQGETGVTFDGKSADGSSLHSCFTDRPLQHINKKGRPVSQCQHCRAMRKSRSAHSKCDCGEKTHKCAHLKATVEGHKGERRRFMLMSRSLKI